MVAQSRALNAKQPTQSSVVDSGNTPSRGTRRAVGLNPTRPQKAAGMRQEPPVSVPTAARAMPAATETAAPADDPPGMRGASVPRGLAGVP
jgi:hypothetical protein